jgi:hypothetical protein
VGVAGGEGGVALDTVSGVGVDGNCAGVKIDVTTGEAGSASGKAAVTGKEGGVYAVVCVFHPQLPHIKHLVYKALSRISTLSTNQMITLGYIELAPFSGHSWRESL